MGVEKEASLDGPLVWIAEAGGMFLCSFHFLSSAWTGKGCRSSSPKAMRSIPKATTRQGHGQRLACPLRDDQGGSGSWALVFLGIVLVGVGGISACINVPFPENQIRLQETADPGKSDTGI